MLDTRIGAVYWVEAAVGSLPSVVYLMAAPFVAQAILTVCAEAYVPPAGLKVGAATISIGWLPVSGAGSLKYA
ncbi:hypothetical protein D3C78_1935490 [compost metagenome]